VRRLLAIAFLALAACEAPVDQEPTPAAEALPSDPDAFRAERLNEPPAYTGEWAEASEACNNPREIWTIEEYRMGMKRRRFCVFERIFASTSDAGQGWSASARCLADGRQSNDFVFFRVGENRQKLRVTINDAKAVELVRCPMST